MRTPLSLLPLLLAAAPLAAQEEAPPPAPPATPPQADASAPVQDAQALLKQLRAEHEKATQDWMEKARAVAAEAEKSGAKEFEWPERPEGAFLPRFQQAAARYAGTEDAVPFLVWILQNGDVDRDAVKAAAATLSAAHAASPALEEMAGFLPYLAYFLPAEEAAAFAARLEEKNPSPVVRAFAAYTVRATVLKEAPLDSDEYRQARAHVMALVDEARAAKPEQGRMLDQMVVGEITTRENFGIGAVAPDIVGVDLDGVAFKLSDYKGKVLLVDFWGDW